jgi:hypothetical protein
MLDPDGILEPDDERSEPDEVTPEDRENWTREDYERAAEEAEADAQRSLWSAEKSRQLAGWRPDPWWREQKGGLYRPVHALAVSDTAAGPVVFAATTGGVRMWQLATATPGDWLPVGRGAINDLVVDTTKHGHTRVIAVNQTGELHVCHPDGHRPTMVVTIGKRLFSLDKHPGETDTFVFGGGAGLGAITLHPDAVSDG